MSVLDKLRESVILTLPTYSPTTKKLVNSAFDDFERAHPGLVDLTVICKRCGGMPEGELADWDGLRRLADDDRRAWTCPRCSHD